MAKINTGPLISDASGRIGPIVFRRTRFGQVVQAAPKMPPITSATVIANNTLLGDAQRVWGRIPPVLKQQMNRVNWEQPAAPNGRFNREYMHLKRAEPVALVLPYHAHARLVVGAQSDTATYWKLALTATSLFRSGNTPQTQAFALEYPPSMRWASAAGLPPDFTSIRFLKSAVTPPFLVIAWLSDPLWVYGATDPTAEFSGLTLYEYT